MQILSITVERAKGGVRRQIDRLTEREGKGRRRGRERRIYSHWIMVKIPVSSLLKKTEYFPIFSPP